MRPVFQFIYERGIQLLTILIFFGLIAALVVFLKSLPPPANSPFNNAQLFYLDKNYVEAEKIFKELAKKEPDNEEVAFLYGQTLLRNKKRREALVLYQKEVEKHPESVDMWTGLAEANLTLRNYTEAVAVYEKILRERPKEKKIYMLLANAHYMAGQNVKAAEIYRFLINKGWLKDQATKEFKAMYGLAEYDPDMPLELPKYKRPSKMQFNFRTQGNFLQFDNHGEWQTYIAKGVNLSAASPGFYAADPPTEYEIYAEWLKLIAEMNSNIVRTYIMAAPAFYQALKDYNESHAKKLWLMQEVWLDVHDPEFDQFKEAYDLYDPSYINEFKDEIRMVVDVLHGQGIIPKRQSRIGGMFTADVSQYVMSIALGKEVEVYIAVATNERHPEITSYKGKYVSMKKGSAFEAWFAMMCDYTVDYEMTQYNAQRPITVVNAPQFDGIYHVSEASIREQNEWEKKYGLPLTKYTPTTFDNNVVGLDVSLFSIQPPFGAGIFACYHNYPHWPDFMWADPKYADARDEWGHNSFWGYLVDQKNTMPNFPLLLGEYGVSTSWYSVYTAVNSVNQGGYTYREQADIMTRWTKNWYNANFCGGIVFELLDEWWHTSVNLTGFMNPGNRPLWFNVNDGESNYGLITFKAPPPIPLLRGENKDWKKSKKLVGKKWFAQAKPGEITKISAYSDFAFLYLKIDVEPWDLEEWSDQEYWLALSTYPDLFGTKKIAESIPLEIESGVNFLIRLHNDKNGEIVVSNNYNPHQWIEAPPLLGGKELVRKDSLTKGVAHFSPFEDILIPTQMYHIGRDGTIYPALHSNFSPLKYGTADPESPEFSNLAAWHIDGEKGIIELRIPWMSLFVIDPPNRGVMSDLVFRGRDFGSPTEVTPGIGVVGICYDKEKKEIIQTLPAAKNGVISKKELPLYTWDKWVTIPKYEVVIKPLFYELQKLFPTLGPS